MRYVKPAIAVAVALAVVSWRPVAFADENKPWYVGVSANYGHFSASGVESDGTQTIGYFQLVYDNRKWGAGVTSSFASTSYTVGSASSGFDLSGLNDTALTTCYNTNIGKLNLRVGVDLGLPTGQTGLETENLGRSIYEDIREDLLLLNTYGEGLNIAPHFAASIRTGMFTWGLGGRYLNSGEYDPTSDVDGDEFNPGDSYTIVVSSLLKPGETDMVLLTLMRTTFGVDTQGGDDVFRKGDMISLDVRYTHIWSDNTMTTLVAVYSQQDKNERLSEGDVLKSETGNSNANTKEISIVNQYMYDRRITYTGVAGYKVADANEYGESDSLYDGGRDKIYVEPGLVWRLNKEAYTTFKLRYAIINDKKDGYSSQDATYNVYNIDLGLVYLF